jgi:[ribulose-bisphosphate carboxylase]-lysine N-methyltransferase
MCVSSVVLRLTGGDCFLLESIFEAEVWGFMCDPVSEPNEAAVCAAMVEGAREALAGYCSSIEEDLALIRAGTLEPGSRQELAVQVGGCAEGSLRSEYALAQNMRCCTC